MLLKNSIVTEGVVTCNDRRSTGSMAVEATDGTLAGASPGPTGALVGPTLGSAFPQSRVGSREGGSSPRRPAAQARIQTL
jgi:hypothetical protein